MKIKICGLRDLGNIKEVTALKPDYLGFIFYKATPRFVADMPADALNFLPASIIKTGVFVNEEPTIINTLIDKFKFEAIQLHGNENAAVANSFRKKAIVIKAFGLNKDFDFEQLNNYIGKVDYFLFDTKTDLHGGSGNSFDWSLLSYYKLDIPFFLSGGISLENLEEVRNIDHPQFYGVDLNSKFEISPGLKDINKLKQAFEILKYNTNEIRS